MGYALKIKPPNYLSEFDVLKHIRLPNWGRAGRVDSNRPDPEAISGSIYELGKDDERDDGGAPDGQSPVDDIDAEIIEGWIRQVADRHRIVIKLRFYRCANSDPSRPQPRMPSDLRINEAIRALIDLMAANALVHRTIKKLR